jgi:phospholipid/cholesterol/gamma-HCH transport system ATP-binding protein
MLQFVDIKKSFDGTPVLDGVSLSVAPGEVHFIIGTSGAGKSVLIKQAVGLLQPDSGQILLDGQLISGLDEAQYYAIRKRCALVFQQSTLFDTLTCQQNVALPLRKHARRGANQLSPVEIQHKASQLLSLVDMSSHAGKRPHELGDGLKKRVAIARALALSPSYVLFDEPTTSLDPLSARNIDRLILNLARQHAVACVVVSHDLRSIFSIADRITLLYKGKVKAQGTALEIKRHTDPIVAQFVAGLAQGPLETQYGPETA